MCKVRRHGGIAAAIAAGLLFASGQLWAVKAQAAAVTFNIESQPLAKALNAWASQAGLQVLWPAGDSAAYSVSTPVQGTLEPMEALRVLLEGTGLTFSVVGQGRTVAIRDRERSVGLRGTAVQRNASGPSFIRMAATAAEQNDEEWLQEVVVTGTHIRGAPNAASPIIVVANDEIRRTGVASTRELMSRLPQNAGGGINENTVVIPGGTIDNGYAATANLRGLGSSATLVLLDGHRLAPAGVGGAVDISMIPLSAIDRVEIVTDGASATYGSDAVGGIVNFITDRSGDIDRRPIRNRLRHPE